jgi:hypothetical protein
MSTRAAATESKMANALHRRGGTKDAAAPARPVVAPRVKPVRITVDLEPATHKAAKLASVEMSAPLAAVIRALLDELADDPELVERVRARTVAARQ